MEEELKDIVKEMIYSSPLVLLTIKEKKVIDYINNFLPYSTGFEIECNYGKDFKKQNFENIPDIIDVDTDRTEQRFRVPNGIKGIICLYNICEQLKQNSELNPLSGIHYHVDMTDIKDYKVSKEFIANNEEWILSELDNWRYKGTYNARKVSINKEGWLGYRGETFEFRCGEMSFDYNHLVTRIIHANDIIRRLKHQLVLEHIPIYKEIDYLKILDYVTKCSRSINEYELETLTNEIEALNASKEVKGLVAVEEYKEIINNRITKIKRNGSRT